MYAVVIALLVAALVLGGGVHLAEAELVISNIPNPTVKTHTTYRYDVQVEGATGDVRFSIDPPLENARIHPVTGHLVYIPDAGASSARQDLTVRASNGTHDDTERIRVNVGHWDANPVRYNAGSRYLETWTFTNLIVTFYTVTDGNQTQFGDPVEVQGGAIRRAHHQAFGSEHPLPNTLYYAEIRRSSNAAGSDANTFVRFTPGTSGNFDSDAFDTIPNPNTRPAPHAPGTSLVVIAGIPEVFEPDLIDFDGGDLAITHVTNGTLGTANHTETSVTYIPADDADGSDSVTYTVTDNKGTTSTGTINVMATAPRLDFAVPANDEGADFKAIPELDEFMFDTNLINLDNIEYTLAVGLGDPPAAGAEITPEGIFTWTPTEAQGPAMYNIAITLDPVPEEIEAISKQFTLSVTEANQDPVFVTGATHAATSDTVFILELDATDADEPEQDLTYDFVGGSLGAFIVNDTLIWNPDASHITAQQTMTLRVRDNHTEPGESTITLMIDVAEGTGPVISEHGSPSRDAHTTLRLSVRASENTGDVEWSMAAPLVENSRIHPVSGHISYVPTPGQVGRQVLYVNATDDAGTSVRAIPVDVGEPFGTINYVIVYDGLRHRGEFTGHRGTVEIAMMQSDRAGQMTAVTRYVTVQAGQTRDTGVGSNTNAATDRTFYFFAGDRGFIMRDTNIYAQHPVRENGYEIVPNPNSRPRPVAPDITRNIEPGVTEVFAPRLVGMDGDTIRITGVTDGAKGQGTMINDTHVSYMPNAGVGGPDRIVYTVRDNMGRTDTGNIDIILPDIDLLARDDDGIETDEDESVNIPVLDNDEGDDVTVTVTTLPENGTATPEADGTITYSPRDDFNGPDEFMYTITRDDQNSTATVRITIHPVDEPITFQVPPNTEGVDHIVIPELELYDFNINITNMDNVAHTVGLEFGDPPATGADITQAGVFSWEPTEAQGPGLYDITIIIDPEPEGTANVTQQFTLSVTEDNQAPTFDAGTLREAVTGTSFVLDLGVTDADEPEQTLTYDFVGDGLGAFVAGGILVWNPTSDHTAEPQTLTVRVQDSHTPPGEDTVTLEITVTEGTGPAISETANDLQRDAHTTLRLDVSVSESTGDVEWSMADPLVAESRIHPISGQISYVPAPEHAGTTQLLMVNATDDAGTSVRAIPVAVGEPFGEFNDVTLSARRIGPNTITQATASYTSNIGTTYVYFGTVTGSGNVDTNDFHTTVNEGDAGTRESRNIQNGPAPDTVYYFEARQIQNAEYDDRNIFAQWAPGRLGFDIIANPVSRPDPVAPDIARNIAPGVTEVFAPRLVGLDGGDITITGVTDGAKGQGTMINATHVSYAPEAGAGGTDRIVYTVKDNMGRTSTGDINITLPDVALDANDDPNAMTDEDTPVNIDVLANDAGNGLRVTVTTLPRNGTATPHDNGTITYDPEDNFNGVDTFVYTISRDAENDTATVTVTVNPVDDPATFDVPPNDAGAAFKAIPELDRYEFDIGVQNPDNLEYALYVELGDPPADGANITQAGLFTWTPTEAQGPRMYDITIIFDPAPEGRENVTRQFALSVTEVNQNPVFDAYEAAPMIPTNGMLDITLTARDADEPGQTITYAITEQNPTDNPAEIDEMTGRLTWTPVTEETRTITVQASDNFEGTPGTAEAVLTVSVMNLAAVMPSEQTDQQMVFFNIVPFTADPIIGRLLDSDGMTVHDFGTITPTAAMAPINPPPPVPLSQLMTNTTYTFEFARSDDTAYAGDDVIRGTFTTMPAQIALGTIAPQTASEGETVNYTIPLDNPDGQNVTWSVAPDVEDAGITADITADGRFVWMPGEAHGGNTYLFAITAMAQTNTELGQISVTVDETNENPVFATTQIEFDTNVGASFEYDFDATDADIPAQAVSYEIASQNPAENPAEIDVTTGLLTWMPVTVETRTITIRASDNNTAPGTVDTTITVRVLPDLDASDDTIYSPSTGEGTVHVLDVLGNDMAPEGTTIESVTHPAITLGGTEHTDDASAGTAVADGRMINYTEGSFYNMPGSSNVTFTYTILLGTYRDTATVTLINSEIPALVAVDDAYTIMEDQEMILDVLANDTAVQARLAVLAQPENGTATETNNTITYRPNDDFNGQNTFEYTISRGDENDTATVTVTVTPVNDAPVIVDIAGRTVPELEPVRIPLVITDVDNDTSDLIVGVDTSIDDPPQVSGGELVWTPTESQGPGSYTFTVIADDRIDTGSADVTINVTEVNQNPVFDDIELNQNATTGDLFELDLNATDADEPGQTITYAITEQNPSDNPAEIDGTTGEITWTPAVAQNRTITVRASDDHTPNGTADITLTVRVSGQSPLVIISPLVSDEDQTVTFLITPSLEPVPIIGRLLDDSGMEVYNFGRIEQRGPAVPVYPPPVIPLADLVPGETYTYQFARADDTGYAGDDVVEGTVEVPAPEPQAPISLGSVQRQTPSEGDTVDYMIPLDNQDSQTINWILTTDDLGAQITTDGRFVWTPGEEHGGNAYEFEFVAVAATNNANGTIPVEVTETNEDPAFDGIETDHAASVGIEFRLDLNATDTDEPEQTITYEIISQSPPENPAVINRTTGLLIWTPAGIGNRNITVQASDDYTPNGTDTITIFIAAQPPVYAFNDAAYSVSGGNGTVHPLDVLVNDVAPPGTTITSVTHPVIVFNGSQHEDDAGAGTAEIDGDMIRYTEGDLYGANGSSSVIFGYTISRGAETSTGTVILTNSEPPELIAPSGNVTIPEDFIAVITVLPAGEPSETAVNVTVMPENGTALVHVDRAIWYYAAENHYGTDYLEYETRRGNLTEMGTVNITITPVNDAPVIADIGNRTIPELEPITIPLNVTDVDNSTDQLTIGYDIAPDGIQVFPDRITWTPTEAQGPGEHTLAIIAYDGIDTSSQTVVFNVTEVNQDPVFDDIEPNQSATVGELFELDLNATDDDLPGQALTYSIENQSAGAGAAVINGTSGLITWTPDEPGTKTIRATVHDGHAPPGSDTLDIVIAVSDAPAGVPPVLDDIPNMTVNLGETLVFNATVANMDALTLALAFDLSEGPAGAAINPVTGEFRWEPMRDQTGDHPITITVSDEQNSTDSETFVVTVRDDSEPNNNPEAPDILINAELFFPSAVTPAVTDPDGDDITITHVTEPALGILDISMLPQISYTPNQTGIDRLNYTATDSKMGTDTGTITIFINPDGNARPVLEHIYNIGGRVGADLNFTAIAADGEGDPLTFDIANAPDGASITAAGDFSWRPAESQNGTHTVTFIVYDDSGGADWQHVAVTILRENETNLPPVPQDIDAGVVLGGGRGFQPDISDPEGDMTEITRVYDSSLGDVDRSFTSQGIIVYVAGVLGDDEVIYTVSDGRGGFANGTLSITVEEPANVRPLIDFVGDKSVNAGDELSFTVDAEDLDGFVTGFDLEGETQGPSMSPLGVFSWTPTANDVGPHEFTILVFDDAGENSTVSITVTVRPEDFENSPPVAPDVVIMTPQDVLSIVRPTLTDPDEGDPVRISGTGQTTKGQILSGFLRAGIIIYLPNQGESGTEMIPYTIADSSDGNDTAAINVFISARGNTDPILGSIDFRNINAGNPLGFDLEAEDPDGDTISYLLVGAPGNTAISSDGAFSWTPAAADVGNHTFTVIAYDDRGGADSKTAVIRVLPAGTANQAPDAPDSTVTVAPGGSVVITPAISDPDGDRVTITDAVASGTGVVIQSEDSINYIHVATTPTETITYTVTDARGATSTGTITVTIQ